jgi:hypothetical protein
MVFDDSNARNDWNWSPRYDVLSKLVEKMLMELKFNSTKPTKLNMKL